MMRLRLSWGRLAAAEDGQTLVEYGLIIVLVALVIVFVFATPLPAAFADIGEKVANALATS